MNSFASEPCSGVIHNRNGGNMANIVTKLVEKTDGEMPEKVGRVQRPPPPLHSGSGYNPGTLCLVW